MNQCVVGAFEREENLLQAARAVRESGWRIRDAYTPYAVHGLDPIMGLKRSWLPRAWCFSGPDGVVLTVWF